MMSYGMYPAPIDSIPGEEIKPFVLKMNGLDLRLLPIDLIQKIHGDKSINEKDLNIRDHSFIPNMVGNDKCLSILCSNLGYPGYCRDISKYLEMDMNDLFTYGYTNTSFVYPKANNGVQISGNNCKLINVLESLMFWGYKRDIEHGPILNENGTYRSADLKYNALKIQRTPNVMHRYRAYALMTDTGEEDKLIWSMYNLITKRLHNILIERDEDYANYAFTNFYNSAIQVTVNYPQLLFVLGLVDPDILSRILFECEIQAAKYVTLNNSVCYRQPTLREDSFFIREFEENLDYVCKHIMGLIFKYSKNNKLDIDVMNVLRVLDVNVLGNLTVLPNMENTSAEDRKDAISGSVLDEDAYQVLGSIIDLRSFPKYITDDKRYARMRELLLKRLLVTIEQTRYDRDTDVFDGQYKWSIAPQFFKGAHLFLLKNNYTNKVLAFYPDMSAEILSTQEDASIKFKTDFNEDSLVNEEETRGVPFPKKRLFLSNIILPYSVPENNGVLPL